MQPGKDTPSPSAQQPNQQKNPIPMPPTRTISIDRMLVRYARTHLELLETQDEIERGRSLIEHFQKKLAEATEVIEENNREIATLQERLAKYESAKDEPSAPIAQQRAEAAEA